MYTAKIEIGWIKDDFNGETACEIIEKVELYQDFGCLMRMGRMEENEKGQKELDKLGEFLDKYYDGSLTIDDIKNLNVRLGIGAIRCLGIEEDGRDL